MISIAQATCPDPNVKIINNANNNLSLVLLAQATCPIKDNNLEI